MVWARSAALGCAVLGCVASANAADLYRAPAGEPPAFAAAQSWTGFYAGANLGGIIDRDEIAIPGNDGGAGGLGGASLGGSGGGGNGGRNGIAVGKLNDRDLTAGIQAGYNWQRGNLVIGIEGDVGTLGSLDDILASIRGRIGFGSERTLIYGTAGLAYRDTSSRVAGVFVGGDGGSGGNGATGGLGSMSPTTPPGPGGGGGGAGFGVRKVSSNGDGQLGFVGGGGVDYRLARNVSVGVEGLYYTFSEPTSRLGRDDDFFTVRTRLNFHLNGEGGLSYKDAAYEAPVASWTGFYVGGHVGALANTSDNSIGDISLANGQAGTDGTVSSGARGGGGGGGGAVAFASLKRSLDILGGGQIGYNLQAGSFVYGVEADASATADDRHSYLASVRGRFGVAVDNFLLYGTGGVAFTRNEGRRSVFAGNGAPGANGGVVGVGTGAGGAGGVAFSQSYDQDQVGFVVGGGVETKLNSRWNVGLEGLYYGFDNDAVALKGTNGRGFAGGSENDALVVRSKLSLQLSDVYTPLK
jgi:opacity protein-like surface antigen